MIRREVAIVGIGQTAYAKTLPGTAWELAIEAILAALADACSSRPQKILETKHAMRVQILHQEKSFQDLARIGEARGGNNSEGGS